MACVGIVVQKHVILKSTPSALNNLKLSISRRVMAASTSSGHQPPCSVEYSSVPDDAVEDWLRSGHKFWPAPSGGFFKRKLQVCERPNAANCMMKCARPRPLLTQPSDANTMEKLVGCVPTLSCG